LENTKIEIRCPSCQAAYKVALDKIQDKGCHATCKCGHLISISKQGAARKQVPPTDEVPSQGVTIPPDGKLQPRPLTVITPQKQTQPKRKSPLRIAVVCGVLALFVVAGAALLLINKFSLQTARRGEHTTSPLASRHNVVHKMAPPITKQPPVQMAKKTAVAKATGPAEAPESIGDLFNKVNGATATIVTYDSAHQLFKQGSGFFINKKGYFITCYHVMKGAYGAYVQIEDKKKYAVDYVVAADKEKDLIKLAIHIPGGTLSPGMWIGIDDKRPKIAERVLVISTPMGLTRTVSDGIISAIRKLPTKGLVYQMTVPISPGSSGSPVIDMNGKVIGVSFLQLVEGQNLNFSIPSKFIFGLKNDKPLTVAAWTLKVRSEKNDALKQIQDKILSQIDPKKKTRTAKNHEKYQYADEQLRMKLARQVVNESGIARQNRSYGETTLATFEKKVKEDLGTKIKESKAEEKRFKKFKEIIKLVTNSHRLNEYIEGQLASNMSVDELKKVLKWYRSPLGKKISAIEFSSFSEKKEQLRKLRLAFGLMRYQSTKRLTLFERLDRATGATDAMIDLQTNLIIQNQILKLILSDSKMPDQASIDEIVEKFKKNINPYLDSLTAQYVFAGYVYTYRGVDQNDIKKYVQFSEEPAAKRFYRVMETEFNAYLLESHKRILTSIIRVVQNDSWDNIKKDLDQPIV